MWYLVLYLSAYQIGSAIAIIPEKYSTEEACHAAAKSDRWAHSCILAPASLQIAEKPATIPNPINPPPGYYCGNNPDNCKLNINCKGIIESYDNGKVFICR